MRSRSTALVGVLLCVLAFAGGAYAQEQTGAIQGTVKDASGSVLPGVTVEARSPAAVGVSNAVTDTQGIYRFPALPPGTYEVTATLQGFAPAKVGDAVVTLGKMLTIDLVLKIAGVSEQVTVTGESSPLIDVKQNAAFATIQRQTIERIPKGRDFQSILRQAPGAQDESKSGGIQVDGASGSENRFIIDGMDTTQLQNGTSGKTMLLDFVQEVQVKSSGYNAEFGGATGGVVNVLTKSGSNNFHGQAGTYFQNDSMYGKRRTFARFNPENSATRETGLVNPNTDWTYTSPLGDFGGPIMKDRLWFYAGVGYTKNNYTRDAIFKTDPSKTNRHFTWWDDAKYYNYNISTHVSNNLRVKFTGSNQRNANRRTAPPLQPDNAVDLVASTIYPSGVPSKGMTLSPFDNIGGVINQTAFDKRWVSQGSNSTNDVFSGNVDWVIKPTFFVNVSAGSYRTNGTTPPEFRGDQIVHTFSGANSDSEMTSKGFPTVPAQFQQPSGYADNPSSSGTVRNIFTRRFLNANATFFASMKGQHTFKTGMRFERFGNDVLNGNAKPRVTVFWGQSYTNPDTNVTSSGKYGYYTLNQTGTIGKVFSNNYSFWVQDSWDVTSRLTINAGVRTENEHVPSFKDQKQFPDALSITFGFKDKIAPRLGFAYDVKGDGKWKTYGSYGWFYDITKLELPRGSFGGDHWVDYTWTLDDPDFTKIQCGEGTTGCPGRFIGPGNGYDFRHSSNQTDPFFEEYFNRPGMTGIDPNMKPVKTGEFTGGVEHELNPLMSLGVRYVHKWMFRTIEDVGILYKGVEDYLISNPGEGLAVNMEPQFPNAVVPKPKRNYDGLEFRLNRRWSNNWTAQVSYLYSRLYGNYSGLASADENGRVSPNVNRYFDHTVMAYGAEGKVIYGLLPTDRPHTVKVYGAYDFKWGTAVGANWFIESGTPQTTVFLFSGYPVHALGRGDLGRSPVLSQLDLNISQEFKLPGRTRVQFLLNIDNVLDQDTWTNLYAPRGYGPQKYVAKTGAAGSGVVLKAPFPELLAGPYDPEALVASFIAGGGNLMLNPFYTLPNSFQGRREMRFQARITF